MLRVLIACVIGGVAIGQEQLAAEKQAEEIREYALDELGEHRLLWRSVHREAMADAIRDGVIAEFPDGVPAAKLDAVMRLIRGYAESGYKRIVPEVVPAHAAVIRCMLAEIAARPVLSAEGRATLDRQLRELAEYVRTGLADRIPEALAPNVGLDEAALVAQFRPFSVRCHDVFLERATSDAQRQMVRGLKRALTSEEMARAKAWVDGQCTEPKMPRTNVDFETSPVRQRMDVAEFVATGIAHGWYSSFTG